jgi:hypothetical protein
MSGYFESLDWQRKKRYKEKLETVRLSLEDDPYSPDETAPVWQGLLKAALMWLP